MKRDTDKGIKLLTKITAIRWFGWGLGEAFIPLLLLMMSASFFVTGLLTSVFNIFFFLFIPFAGVLADRIKIKYMILAGLIIYVLVGFGYFLAGLTGMIIFLILARALNGISYSLDQIGRESYFIRHTPKKKESQVFGHLDKITSFWWLLAMLLGLFLIKYTEIHWLLLFIVPTSIISFLFALRLKEKPIKKNKQKFGNPYIKLFKEFKNFNKNLKVLAVIIFFFRMMSVIVYYFAPAVSYFNGESMVNAVILIFAYSIPALFGEKLGRFADKIKYKGYFLGLISLVAVLIILAFSPNYYLLLISMFFAGLTFELTFITNKSVMARNSEFHEIGKIDSVLSGIGSLGAILGPILFGILLDVFNPTFSYLGMAFFAVLMFGFVYKNREK